MAEGRAFWQADDVDGITRIACDGTVPPPGSLVDVAIERVADDYDFDASLVRVISSPASARAARTRALPVVGASLGSYGR